ncbi:MAG: TetR/AcrR family transcriptional regulator [Trueperaceae bacterium]|nr:TetR/AcrR family transcriptional regulator [Trueperaceae bacterium]
MPRVYDMTHRARRTERTAERIAASAEALLAAHPIGEVTLQAIADGAGVSVQTVLRHMGSRDGCIDAVGHRVAARVEAQRSRSAPGDVDAAIGDLLEHYEAEGRLVLNLLAQERSGEALAQRAAQQGREVHRAWVQRTFAPRLPDRERGTIDALVAATDLYLWKLLRLDLGRSPAQARSVMTRLVRGVLEAPCPES